MRKQPVTAMPTQSSSRVNAGWQTLNAQQFSHFNGQVQCYQSIRQELELIPTAERPIWLEGLLLMLMNQFKPGELPALEKAA